MINFRIAMKFDRRNISYEAPSLFSFDADGTGLLCESYVNTLPELVEEDGGITWDHV